MTFVTCLSVYLGFVLQALLITSLIIQVAQGIGAADRPRVCSVYNPPVSRFSGQGVFPAAKVLSIVALFIDSDMGGAFRAPHL